MSFLLHVAANGDLFSIGKSLTGKLSTLAAAGVILLVGVIAAGCVARHEAGKAVAVILIALIPIWLLVDPSGAMTTMKATISAL